MKLGINSRAIYTFVSAAIIVTGTFVAIQYAKGYYRITRSGVIDSTGLLNVNSFPSGAEVKVNNKLVTATDDTIYLEPGDYQVEINKDGYSPWRKTLHIERELVTQTNAMLFRIAPGLTPLTFTGAENISPSPDGQKIVYYTASASADARKGLYILELNDTFLTQRSAQQISDDIVSMDLTTAEFIWSPDSSQLLVLTPNKEVLLETDRKNELATLPDVSFQRRQLLATWEEEMYQRERQFLTKFPPELIAIATQSARNVYLSPDKKRLMYTATQAVTIPEGIVPPLPATNTQPEVRQLTPGHIYVYDREEDKNFEVTALPAEPLQAATAAAMLNQKQLLADDLYNRVQRSLAASPSAFQRLQVGATTSAQLAHNFRTYHTPLYTHTYQWFPDSKHLMFVRGGRIQVMEYDGSNDTTLYSGPFAANFVYPWPDGSKVVIMTSFSPDSPQNLYQVELK